MASEEQLTRVFSTFTDPSESTSTVIIGAGIIGCATAYYLATSGNTRPDTIHLVEVSPELFASASGNAGGFLAEDWYGPATASLGELSFRLHKELAEAHNGREQWGYSRSTGTSFAENDERLDGEDGGEWLNNGGSRAEVAGSHEFFGDQEGPAWLTRRRGEKVEVISEGSSTAQVDPFRLSKFLLRESLLKGVRFHNPTLPLKLSRDGATGCLSALRVRHGSGAEHKLPCTRLLIAAGAWTPKVYSALFPDSRINIGVGHLAGHSLVVKSPRWTKEHESTGCHAVFSTGKDGFSPEIFSRVGEEIYIAGLNDASMELPEVATQAKTSPKSIEALKRVAQRLLGKDGTDVSDLEVLREGVCFRPTTNSGSPIIARVPDEDLGGLQTNQAPGEGGVFVAAGHGPWGISLGLGTGKVVQELIEGLGELSADVGRLGLQ